jgi:hypothetical protein
VATDIHLDQHGSLISITLVIKLVPHVRSLETSKKALGAIGNTTSNMNNLSPTKELSNDLNELKVSED